MRLFLLLSILTSLAAQDFRATLAGTVTDPTGAAIAKARLKAVNTQTNATAEVTSNESGRYSIPLLSKTI